MRKMLKKNHHFGSSRCLSGKLGDSEASLMCDDLQSTINLAPQLRTRS